jgi:hypothetical protein
VSPFVFVLSLSERVFFSPIHGVSFDLATCSFLCLSIVSLSFLICVLFFVSGRL